MKNKDRVVIKDYFLSVLCSGAIAALIVMVFIPILLYTIGRQIGEGIPVFSVFFSGTLESIAVVEVITHIVLGALVLQYMRLYMFMGLTRDRAFLRMMLVEGMTLILTFLCLAVIGTISGLIAGTLEFSSMLLTCLYITLACTLMFGVGCVSSALSTTCRPPLSVAVVVLFLIFMSWLYEKASNMVSTSFVLDDGLHVIFSPTSYNTEAIMAFVFGVIMTAIAYVIYKLPISQMKSTSIN